MSQRKAIALLVCTAVLWSAGGFLIKWIPWHPLAIAGVRSAIAIPLLWAILRRPNFSLVGGPDWRRRSL